jgi:ApeA N-terminal domain 1
METLSIIGTWWVPSKGQSRAAGTLTFSENEGVRLEVDKSLTVGKDKIIIGRAGGRDVTLQGCYEISSTSVGGALRIAGQEYLVETAFLGAALTKSSQFRFAKASFGFTHLIDWVATSGIKAGYTADKKFTVTYQRPDDISIILPEATLGLAFSGKYPFGGPTLTIQEAVRLDLTTKVPKTIDEIVNAYVTPVWDLLRLSTQCVTIHSKT